jgi:hypothetical protein
MGANMRQLKHGLLILALGFPLSTFASPQFSDSSLPSPKGDCAGVTPSYGLVRQTVSIDAPGPQVEGYIYGDNFEGGDLLMNWADLFGTDFPSRPSSATDVSIEVGKFIALEFTTGAPGDPIYAGVEFGTLEVSQASANNGQLALSISTCPGDFTNPSVRCRFNGGQGVFAWMLTPGDPFACTVAHNATYYLNLAHVDANTGASSCTNPEGAPARCSQHISAH